MEKKLCSLNGIRLATKCRVYKVVALPPLLYSTETDTLYREHIRKLWAIQKIHLTAS